MTSREGEMDYVEAGKNLRERRERRAWSRERLAELSGVSATAIRQYETGRRPKGEKFRPNRSKLRALAEVFGWPEGAEILEIFGEHELAAQLERELLTGASNLAVLTNEQQEVVREINRLILSLVTERA